MASSTRPSMLSSPPQKPSPSEADKRRASCCHSRKILSFMSRDSVGCVTTSFGSAKKDLGCWSAASMSSSEAACVMGQPSREGYILAQRDALRVAQRHNNLLWASPSTSRHLGLLCSRSILSISPTQNQPVGP